MVYYDVKIKYTQKKELKEQKLKEAFYAINGVFWHNDAKEPKLLIYNHTSGTANAIITFAQALTTLSGAKKEIKKSVASDLEPFTSFDFSGTAEEVPLKIAIKKIINGLNQGYRSGNSRNAAEFCEAEYWNGNLEFDEIILPHAHTTYSEAIDKSHSILAGKSFFEEIERIYSPLNKHKFYGNPVHYIINAASRESGKRVLKLLTKALFTNQRILSSRVTYVTDLGDRYWSSDLPELCDNSYGSIVAIECPDESSRRDNYASDIESAIECIADTVHDYYNETLFVLININGSSKTCKSAVSKLSNEHDIDFVEISEGKGNKNDAKRYLNSLLKENKVPFSKGDFILPEQEEYDVSDVVAAFKDIRKNSIKNSIYKSYKDVKSVEVAAPKSLSSSYDKLQNMVGLTEIKSIIDQIISAQKINKLRKDMGLDVAETAKHMIFTGNPGSAKTTVARLLASILYDEHVIPQNKFIECGRQDLVGRYVGWTAKQVEEQFHKATGGILFIDEAYSLVDGSNSFGDEAINTIVQEMENHRDDVIVIFAGYPDKMKKFLEKNEGLRSRIAFHIDFPDYNGEELCDILKLMTEDKGYTLDDEAAEKCREIFESACKNAEFGNGRFVRNVLEQAIIKQSYRIVSEYSGDKVDKKVISILSAADFDINAAATYKSPKVAIGF